MTMNRRQFAQGIAGAFAASLHAQNQSNSEWGGPIVDCHHHPRRTAEANTAHLDGAGISNAMLLARANYVDSFKELQEKYPGRYLGWFASTDITRPDADKTLEQAIKAGASTTDLPTPGALPGLARATS